MEQSWKDWACFLVSHITITWNSAVIYWEYRENYSYIKQSKSLFLLTKALLRQGCQSIAISSLLRYLENSV